MRKWLILSIMLILFAIPANAADTYQMPEPESGSELLPAQQSDFAGDLMYVIRQALSALRPDFTEGVKVCLGVFGVVLLSQLALCMVEKHKNAVELCSVIAVSGLLTGSARSLISLAADTVEQICQYGRLMLPVMAGALAAQGGTSSSAALYAGTALFDSVLSSLTASCLVPLVYGYIALSVANAATGEAHLLRLRDFAKWATTWSLKLILYLFLGYMSLTGVISGTTDQLTLKATKLTISGAVPVVGGILSDASETVILSVGLMKNAAGIYGILAVAAIFIGPFLKIGAHYLLLKLTAFFAGVICGKRNQELIDCFSSAMGLLLAMTGVVCLLQLVSLVCFLRGVGF